MSRILQSIITQSIIGNKEDMEIMSSSLSLRTTSKETDNIKCEKCEKGIFIPDYPESEINHSFHCNYCGIKVHLEADVVVE